MSCKAHVWLWFWWKPQGLTRILWCSLTLERSCMLFALAPQCATWPWNINTSYVRFKQLLNTLWSCRERALKTLESICVPVVKLLDDMSESDPPDLTQVDAKIHIYSLAVNPHLSDPNHCSSFRLSAGRKLGPLHCQQLMDWCWI